MIVCTCGFRQKSRAHAEIIEHYMIQHIEVAHGILAAGLVCEIFRRGSVAVLKYN